MNDPSAALAYSTGAMNGTPVMPKPVVSVRQIDNGFIVAYYDNKSYKTYEHHEANIGTISDRLKSIFDTN